MSAGYRGWRKRLCEAVQQSGKKHYLIAMDAGIAPETLSRILAGKETPGIETALRIANACGVTLGELFGERKICVTQSDHERLIGLIRATVRLLKGDDE